MDIAANLRGGTDGIQRCGLKVFVVVFCKYENSHG
jgi:hypothetical protein